MANMREVYVCELCGNIVEVLTTGGGHMACCGRGMTLQNENSVDASVEKHVPVYKLEGDTVHVTVGGVPHPMEATHYIQWIECWEGDRVQRLYLKPGEGPKASFSTAGGQVSVRAFCNLHGLWGAK